MQKNNAAHISFVKTTAIKIAIGILTAILLLVNLFNHVLPIVKYYGDGMEPAIKGGQTLVLFKTKDVEEGDLVAFYYNNKVLVRRVICEGNKMVSIEKDGTVYINSTPLDEPYLKNKSLGQCNLDFPHYVRNDHVFVMGDNRSEAMDSRLSEIGQIPLERIIGKVILAF